MTALAPRSSASSLDRLLLRLSARLEALAVRRMQRRAPAALPPRVVRRHAPSGRADAAAVHMGLLPR
ncbi:hypothetical protein ACTU3I_17235 [Microbacterium sp. RD1]|uniref:hypothetical protein n=1 Tax=Microbacterium sp. RD1 TaxID=3457313 RepID=UPI003FA5AB85